MKASTNKHLITSARRRANFPHGCLEGTCFQPVASVRLVQISLALLLLLSFSQPMAEAQFVGNAASQPLARYLLIEFFSYDTMESKMVRDLIINSGTASEIIRENYQLVSVERGKDPDKEALYKINRYPTLVIAQPDGAEIDRIVGFLRPAEVAATLKAAASGKSELARVKEKAAADGAGIRAHMALASAMRLRGDQEGALKEYLWILDHGKQVEPKMYPSAFRVVIQQLVSASKEYPAAMEELKKWQETVAHEAGDEKAPPEAIERAFVMNEILNATSRNVSLYLRIPETSPLKRKLFTNIFPALVKAGKYQEAAGVADLEAFVGSLYPRFHSEHGHEANDGHNHAVPATSTIKQRITTYASAACEALLALGQVEKARRVAGRALDYLGTDSQPLIARLNAIADQPHANAGDFSTWLKTYSQSGIPPKNQR